MLWLVVRWNVSITICMYLLNVLFAEVKRGDVETKLGEFVLLTRACLSAIEQEKRGEKMNYYFYLLI